ncbi:uncharacterized protein TRAVEDRAFT_51086 [Trametes versicolor FP-101664 SS1]|uniref:uncharacterized protein n=1 Tax=Trametes versicolor (strain FP-101664) TaxID=717944 RepID=UPI000462242D|nr:uncharacterized protein TRAVEDRAFT_51086 [Trametes versicolor FP-101664 SS1]EIW54956.1 hypothetical protein TRAVEDRAFT_51086 [Trametes versicolor FP-101664 SS1]
MSMASLPVVSLEDEEGDDSDSGSGSSVWIWWLPFACPLLAARFSSVPLPPAPRVVILDTFGVILVSTLRLRQTCVDVNGMARSMQDREGAILNALEPWLPLVRHRPRDSVAALKLYIELEALAARELCAGATSLPVIFHTALATFSTRLGLPAVFRSTFFADAAASILHPQPYEDAERAVAQLSQRGCTIVALVPFSASTLAAVLPPRLRAAGVQLFPCPIPLHVAVPATFFATLRRWCQQVLPSCHGGCAPEEIVVGSGGVGRILAWASTDMHPTVLIKRPGGIECDVNFVVGTGHATPQPSAVVGGLDGLCRALSF